MAPRRDDVTNSSKRKGDKAELEVQALLRDHLGVPARRALGAGRIDDMGDIDGVPDTVIQVANWASLDRAVREKLPDLERQQANAHATHAALFCRRVGGTWVIVLTPQMWFTLIREAVDLGDDIPLEPIPGQTTIELP
jgi:hypothetical protein